MENAFLGTGWSFPPTFSLASKGVEMASGAEDIRQSLEILLNTRPGERVMQPDFGCDMGDFVFEPLNTTTKTLMKDRIQRAILYYESRIDVQNITLEDAPEGGMLMIDIEFIVRATNSRMNLVFPFYLEEGRQQPMISL